jgi:hypothetical protein
MSDERNNGLINNELIIILSMFVRKLDRRTKDNFCVTLDFLIFCHAFRSSSTIPLIKRQEKILRRDTLS